MCGQVPRTSTEVMWEYLNDNASLREIAIFGFLGKQVIDETNLPGLLHEGGCFICCLSTLSLLFSFEIVSAMGAADNATAASAAALERIPGLNRLLEFAAGLLQPSGPYEVCREEPPLRPMALRRPTALRKQHHNRPRLPR